MLGLESLSVGLKNDFSTLKGGSFDKPSRGRLRRKDFKLIMKGVVRTAVLQTQYWRTRPLAILHKTMTSIAPIERLQRATGEAAAGALVPEGVARPPAMQRKQVTFIGNCSKHPETNSLALCFSMVARGRVPWNKNRSLPLGIAASTRTSTRPIIGVSH